MTTPSPTTAEPTTPFPTTPEPTTAIPTTIPTTFFPTKAGTNINDITWSYENFTSAVYVNLIDRTIIVGDSKDTLLENIKNIKGSAFNDILIGNTYANRLEGSAGDDILEGGVDADVLDGGLGVDTVSYKASGSGINVSLKPGATNQGGDAAGDVLSNVENLIGSKYPDILIGSGSTVNILDGGAGDDILEASNNDVLIGGTGKDTFRINDGAYSVTIKDFDNTSEQIDLRAWKVKYGDLNIVDTEDNGIDIRFLDNGMNKRVVITLEGVAYSELSKDNFIFMVPPQPQVCNTTR